MAPNRLRILVLFISSYFHCKEIDDIAVFSAAYTEELDINNNWPNV